MKDKLGKRRNNMDLDFINVRPNKPYVISSNGKAGVAIAISPYTGAKKGEKYFQEFCPKTGIIRLIPADKK